MERLRKWLRGWLDVPAPVDPKRVFYTRFDREWWEGVVAASVAEFGVRLDDLEQKVTALCESLNIGMERDLDMGSAWIVAPTSDSGVRNAAQVQEAQLVLGELRLSLARARRINQAIARAVQAEK